MAPTGRNWTIGIALSVAWASGDERRLRRALSLGNLQWLLPRLPLRRKLSRDRGLMRDFTGVGWLCMTRKFISQFSPVRNILEVDDGW